MKGEQDDRAMPILIVSTDYDARTIFATALRSRGYTVRELTEPSEIVAAAHDCDLVITDYPTTTESGDTVTELLRADPRTRNIKILNATTHAFLEEIGDAVEAGVDATVVLPALPDEVVARVERLLADRDSVAR
jgi:CheY-like chemotaxis protein